MNAPHNPNRSLIRILLPVAERAVFVYSLIAVSQPLRAKDINATELAIVCSACAWMGAVRGRVPLGLVRRAAGKPVRLMGASFEAHYAALNTKTKIRSIVLVTML